MLVPSVALLTDFKFRRESFVTAIFAVTPLLFLKSTKARQREVISLQNVNMDHDWIEDLTINDLRKEVKKRNVKAKGSKQELKDQLKHLIQNEELDKDKVKEVHAEQVNKKEEQENEG